MKRLVAAMVVALLVVPQLAAPADGQDVRGAVRQAGPPSPPGGPVPTGINPMNLFLQTTVRGGISVGATCINFQEAFRGGPNGGPISVLDIPLGASVLHAYLYWTILSDQFPVPTGNPRFNFTEITPIPLGSVPRSPCFSQANTGTFRADVTALVNPGGNGNYILTNFPGTGTGDGTITEGATLVIVYCHADSPLRDVVIWEGTEVVNGSERSFSQDITGFTAGSQVPVEAFLGVAAGNGQDVEPDPFLFNGTDLDQIHPEILSGAACTGMFYDLTAYDVTGLVGPGATSANLLVQIDSDCYTFAAIALSVSRDAAGAVDACELPVCGGQVVAPDSVAACDGGPAQLNLGATYPSCPQGPVESADQVTDPITAMNASTDSDLAPDLTTVVASRATLTTDLTGDTDLTACVEIDLIDPSGTPLVVKAEGQADAGTYDVTALYAGPGAYGVRLSESQGCGSQNQFATLSGVVLEVEEQSSLPAIEYRVEDSAGVPVCDWSSVPDCSFTPATCPGSEVYIARARCTFDPTCDTAKGVDVLCSLLQADFAFDAPCGTTEVCFRPTSSGAYGSVSYTWDFDGQGSSAETEPCFTFTGDGPWQVTMTATDDALCSSRQSHQVAPDPGGPPMEPSAIDITPSVTPLLVARSAVPGVLDLTWEDLGASQTYNVYRGVLGDWYSHGEIGLCGLADPGAEAVDPAGNHYYIAVGVNCASEESSYGRSSAGSERPDGSAVALCP